MTLTLFAAMQALVFTGGCRLIHGARLHSEPIGTALAVLATVLAMTLGATLAFTVLPPDAVSDGAVRAVDPAFDLFGS